MPNEQPTWIVDMLAALESPTIDSVDILRALEIKNEHIPERLYRYRSITDLEWENLRSSKMWMSAAIKYNDPFDSGVTVEWPTLEISAMKKTISNASYPWLNDQVRQRLLIDQDPTVEFLALTISGGVSPTEDVKVIVRQNVEKYERQLSDRENPSPLFQKAVHVCSLSENPASLLMWSHYAGQHEGFCVEYDFSRLPHGDINRSRLYPVIYSGKRFDSSFYLAEGISDITDINNLFVLLASLHKSPEWSYEKEWRLIHLAPDSDTTGTLTEMPRPSHVYLGARIIPENEAKAIAICADLGIPTSKMKLSDTEYRLEPRAYPIQTDLRPSED